MVDLPYCDSKLGQLPISGHQAKHPTQTQCCRSTILSSHGLALVDSRDGPLAAASLQDDDSQQGVHRAPKMYAAPQKCAAKRGAIDSEYPIGRTTIIRILSITLQTF